MREEYLRVAKVFERRRSRQSQRSHRARLKWHIANWRHSAEQTALSCSNNVRSSCAQPFGWPIFTFSCTNPSGPTSRILNSSSKIFTIPQFQIWNNCGLALSLRPWIPEILKHSPKPFLASISCFLPPPPPPGFFEDYNHRFFMNFENLLQVKKRENWRRLFEWSQFMQSWIQNRVSWMVKRRKTRGEVAKDCCRGLCVQTECSLQTLAIAKPL